MEIYMTSPKILLVGYFPHYYMPNGYSPGTAFDLKTYLPENAGSADFANNVDQFLNSLPQFNTYGVLWIIKENNITPVIICNKAKETKDHLLYWTQNQPSKWFKFYHGSHSYKGKKGYGVILHPDLQLSLNRFKLANSYLSNQKLNADNSIILFHPISVLATVSDHYLKFVSSNPKSVNLMLVDNDYLSSLEHMSKMDEKELVDLGQFSVASPSWNDVKKRLKDQIENYIDQELTK